VAARSGRGDGLAGCHGEDVEGGVGTSGEGAAEVGPGDGLDGRAGSAVYEVEVVEAGWVCSVGGCSDVSVGQGGGESDSGGVRGRRRVDTIPGAAELANQESVGYVVKLNQMRVRNGESPDGPVGWSIEGPHIGKASGALTRIGDQTTERSFMAESATTGSRGKLTLRQATMRSVTASTTPSIGINSGYLVSHRLDLRPAAGADMAIRPVALCACRSRSRFLERFRWEYRCF